MATDYLISAALLSLYSDKKNSDTIDLITPFTKIALHLTYEEGDQIDISIISERLSEEFGYKNIPNAAVEKCLQRIIKKDINKSVSFNKKLLKYTLERKFYNEYNHYKTKISYANEIINEIVRSLKDYLEGRKRKTFTDVDVKTAFLKFIDINGYSIYLGESNMQAMDGKENINKLIATFILNVKNEDEIIFEYILRIIKGNFVSKVIYFSYDSEVPFNAKIKDTILILDAPVMLKILGLKSRGENEAAKQFISLLPNNIKLRYFRQNYEELEGIIGYYKYRDGSSTMTIEFFEENNYSSDDVDEYLLLMEGYLKKANIWEIETPEKVETHYYIDESALSKCLESNLKYKTEKALAIDVKTISDVNQIRKGDKSKIFENCKCLFITQNPYLVTCINTHFDFKNKIGFAMTDIDLTILLWLKKGNFNSEIPKQLLIANSMTLSEEISDSFMSAAFEKINNIVKQGKFDNDMATLMRENTFLKKEIALLAQDDPENVTVDLLNNIKVRYDRKVEAELSSKLEKATQELEENKKSGIEAQRNIEKNLTEKSKKLEKIINKFSVSVLILLEIFFLVLSIYFTVTQIIQDDFIWGPFLIIFTILMPIYELLAHFIGKLKGIRNIVKKFAFNVSERYKEKKRKEYNKLFISKVTRYDDE